MSDFNIQLMVQEGRDEIELAVKYFSFFFAINNYDIPQKEIELLAFTVVRGTITPKPAREEFVERFGGSIAYVENLKGELVKKGFLIKTKGKHRAQPWLCLDFSKKTVIKLILNKKAEAE